MIDESKLTDRERRNLAAVRIAREHVRRKYGTAIQVLTTDEEAVEAAGGAAIPIGQLSTNKPLTMGWTWKGKGNEDTRMEDRKAYTDVTQELIKTEKRLLGKSTVGSTPKPAKEVVDDAEPVEEAQEIGRVSKTSSKKSTNSISKADREALKKLLAK